MLLSFRREQHAVNRGHRLPDGHRIEARVRRGENGPCVDAQDLAVDVGEHVAVGRSDRSRRRNAGGVGCVLEVGAVAHLLLCWWREEPLHRPGADLGLEAPDLALLAACDGPRRDLRVAADFEALDEGGEVQEGQAWRARSHTVGWNGPCASPPSKSARSARCQDG